MSQAPSGRASRKLVLASACAATGAIVAGWFWFGNRWAQQPVQAEKPLRGGNEQADEGRREKGSALYPGCRPGSTPTRPRVTSDAAGILDDQGKVDEAIAEYHAVIRLKPDDGDAYFLLGDALQTQGKIDEAIAAYRAAIRIRPREFKTHYVLGAALVSQGNPEEAMDAFQKAIQINPGFVRARVYLGLLLQSQGKVDEAITEFRAAIAVKPDDARRTTAWAGPCPCRGSGNRPLIGTARPYASSRTSPRPITTWPGAFAFPQSSAA